MGCDAPFGSATKLLRKVVFVPQQEKCVPRLYTAATDMLNGARIVAVYGNDIVLYSVPPDVCQFSRSEQEADTQGDSFSPPLSSGDHPSNHWLNWLDVATSHPSTSKSNNGGNTSIWPLAISGTKIGSLAGICELSIQTRPDIIIRAFSSSLLCKTWRLRSYNDPVTITKQYVCQSGIVHDLYSVDESSDVIMIDAPSSSPTIVPIELHVAGEDVEMPRAERSVLVGLDGDASGVLKRVPRALAVENDEWVDFLDVRGCSQAWYEEDGDVVMWYEN